MSRPRYWSVALTSLFVLALACSTTQAASDFPTPSPYPISWELAFTHGLPKRIVVDVPSSAVPLAYWYMTYTVTNNGNQEQLFFPQIEMMTDNGHLLNSNVNIPPQVFDAIKTQEHNKLLEPITSITGRILLGEAEARDGVAIWPESTPRMGHFSIFVTGLSGEAVTLKKIDGRYQKVDKAEDMKNPKDLVILRKTLQLNFFIRGDEVYPGEDQVNQDSEVWIMR
jgi:hypothetical protein